MYVTCNTKNELLKKIFMNLLDCFLNVMNVQWLINQVFTRHCKVHCRCVIFGQINTSPEELHL